jgi:ribonucleoside-diphosphate reductase alpha chain
MLVTKRDGSKELIDLEKIHRVITWAAEGLRKVSVSQVEMNAEIQFHENIETSKIHDVIIKAAADLISVETPDYQYLSARLAMFQIRKKAYKTFEPPSLLDHINKVISLGMYDPEILNLYTKDEINEIESFIVHSRDMTFSYAAVNQLEGKYLVKDRTDKTNGKIYETPQFLYALISATLFSKYPKDVRMNVVKRFYDAISQFKISLPTPIMSGVRTRTKQFSSCVKIDCGDSLDSIAATSGSILKYVSQRAGIGINGGRLRALGSKIRNGEASHTGLIPFYKYFQTSVKSCSQGGVRGGAATVFYPMWHKDVESLLVLKNNRGVEDNRVRHLDYCVQLNRLMYQRLMQGGVISLFCPTAVKGMYEAFFNDQEKFERLYLEAESNPLIERNTISAVELFSSFGQERASTGRIYAMNVDHVNTYGAFIEKVATTFMSNLCLEITLPTAPLNDVKDPDGEIALCTLAALNLGLITSEEEMEEMCDLAVRALDALLDYQDYPIIAARLSTLKRRSLGIGVVNFANRLAKEGVKYSDGSANNLTHRIFESMQYYLLKSSCQLAKEMGPCPGFGETKYSQGIMPVDNYKKHIDTVCDQPLLKNWDVLRADILTYGLRNSTMSAIMPSETSSQISNATNGIEPPRGLISVKSSKEGNLKQVVPDFDLLKDKYELLWDIPDNTGYLTIVGIIQKFVDQAISANTSYDPSKFESNKVPMTLILKDMLNAYKLGVKTLYYHNTRDGAGESEE